MGRCGKRKRQEWFHVAPDGTPTECRSLTEALRLMRLEGGMYEKRTWRETPGKHGDRGV